MGSIPYMSLLTLTELTFFYEVIQSGPSYVKQGSVDEFEELLSPVAEELIVHMSVTTIYS